MQPKRYDPGEHRHKHCWKEPLAGFSEQGGILIGKCPATLSKLEAERLLNDGLAYPPDAPVPQRIYNTHAGVIYEAVPSGDAWHGYPWRYRPGRRALPRQLLRQLEARAAQQGCLREFQRWMKEHGQ